MNGGATECPVLEKNQLKYLKQVTVTITEDNVVTVKGPKGELTNTFNTDIKIEKEDNVITLIRPSESKEHRSIHGTTRSLLDNMVTGVSKGFERSLELVGVGYRAQLQGQNLF